MSNVKFTMQVSISGASGNSKPKVEEAIYNAINGLGDGWQVSDRSEQPNVVTLTVEKIVEDK